jgi:hypothetical protein
MSVEPAAHTIVGSRGPTQFGASERHCACDAVRHAIGRARGGGRRRTTVPVAETDFALQVIAPGHIMLPAPRAAR